MGNDRPSAIDERPQLIALFCCVSAALTLKIRDPAALENGELCRIVSLPSFLFTGEF
jgi:hypothetical protein